ncbi:MAG: hypothetical protein KKA19_04075, partial [Candidatus Margulisbacteria bacterium]|nr:hypothetical protein [Candidatus Margulisiibacteriota bacterium]
GYPIFLVFIAFWGHQFMARWRWLFLALSVISLVSLMNTFCHIHAPIFLSVLRSFNGFVLGIFAGLIYILAINIAIKIWKFIAY